MSSTRPALLFQVEVDETDAGSNWDVDAFRPV